MELVHTIFLIQTMYSIVVVDFGTIEGLSSLPFTLEFSVTLSTLISWIVQVPYSSLQCHQYNSAHACHQAFFCYRVRVLSGRWEIPVLALILNTARSTDGIAVTARLVQTPNLEVFNAKYPWLVTFGMAIGTFADALVAVSMCYYLYRSRTGMHR
jgi:hypothetical protein